MSVCAKCGAEFAKVCRPCHSAACAAWRAKNPAKVRAYKKSWCAENSIAVASHSAAWREKNRDVIGRLNDASTVDVSDAYAAALLGLPVSIVPRPLIELKREHLKIARFLKENK